MDLIINVKKDPLTATTLAEILPVLPFSLNYGHAPTPAPFFFSLLHLSCS